MLLSNCTKRKQLRASWCSIAKVIIGNQNETKTLIYYRLQRLFLLVLTFLFSILGSQRLFNKYSTSWCLLCLEAMWSTVSPSLTKIMLDRIDQYNYLLFVYIYFNSVLHKLWFSRIKYVKHNKKCKVRNITDVTWLT